jgi:hypothetical protein
VRQHCAELDIPYTEMNLWTAHVHVAKYVHNVGLAARDPFACGFRAMYRRS